MNQIWQGRILEATTPSKSPSPHLGIPNCCLSTKTFDCTFTIALLSYLIEKSVPASVPVGRILLICLANHSAGVSALIAINNFCGSTNGIVPLLILTHSTWPTNSFPPNLPNVTNQFISKLECHLLEKLLDKLTEEINREIVPVEVLSLFLYQTLLQCSHHPLLEE